MRPPKDEILQKCLSCFISCPLAFDENGICSGCETAQQRAIPFDWDKKKMFERLIDGYESKTIVNMTA